MKDYLSKLGYKHTKTHALFHNLLIGSIVNKYYRANV